MFASMGICLVMDLVIYSCLFKWDYKKDTPKMPPTNLLNNVTKNTF